DEITELTLRASFSQQIENIHVSYPKAPIIVTSRIAGYREMGHRFGPDFEQVTLTNFSQEDKDEFARRWCSLTELADRAPEATARLIRAIHSHLQIERLTGNPMLLTTMALVSRNGDKLFSRRIDLYNEATKVLLNWRPEQEGPLEPSEAFPQLKYIAYAMC